MPSMPSSPVSSPRRAAAALPLLLALSLPGAGCALDEASGEAPLLDDGASALTNSEVDEGHPAVVTFFAQDFIFCTGTVIAPRIVLTAGHCAYPDLTGVQPEEIEVVFGTDATESEQRIAVVDGIFHPDFDVDELYGGGDVGMFRLAEDAPVDPVAIGVAPAVGSEVTLVGFGVDSDDGFGGVKRVSSATVTATTSELFTIDSTSSLCHGDSGGPALQEVDGVETIVGIASVGACGGSSTEQRIDLHVETFILPWAATCDADNLCASGCAAPDPDCPCAADGHCGDGCDPPATDVDCPACAADGVCDAGCPGGAIDPDCGGSTSSTGASSSASGGEGGAEGDDGDGEAAPDDGGCAVGGSARGGTDLGRALLAVAMAALVLRRGRGR
jgi:hypothetical protein